MTSKAMSCNEHSHAVARLSPFPATTLFLKPPLATQGFNDIIVKTVIYGEGEVFSSLYLIHVYSTYVHPMLFEEEEKDMESINVRVIFTSSLHKNRESQNRLAQFDAFSRKIGLR